MARNSKAYAFFASLGLILGIVFLTVGVLLTLRSQTIREDYVKTQGEVMALSRRSATVRYQVGPMIYRRPLKLYNALLDRGDTLEIYYDPQSPATIASQMDTLVLPLFFGSTGAALIAFGSTGIALKLKKLKKRPRQGLPRA